MQISRQTVAEWLNGRPSAEFCRDQHGFFTHTIEVDAETRTIRMMTHYCDAGEIPPKVAVQRINPDAKLSELARSFCHERGAKMQPTGMYVWSAGVWIP